MNYKKVTTPLLVLALITNFFLVVPKVSYAQDGTDQQQNLVVNFFHRMMMKFGFEKGQDSASNSADERPKNNRRPEGSPMPGLSGTPGANRMMGEEQRLEQLVKDGKITEAQKTAIITEVSALQSKYSLTSLKDLTQAERKAKLEEMVAELKAWAKAQGIDESYVTTFGGWGNQMMNNDNYGRGRRMMGGNGRPMISVTPTPTS